MQSRTTLALLLTAALFGGCSSSQTAPTHPNPAAPARITARGSDDAMTPADASLGAAAAKLGKESSIDDRVDLARQIADGLRLRSDRVHRWLRDSRRAKYLVRTDCLDDMLSQVHAVERLASQSQRAAHVAATREDGDGVNRELSRLVVYEQRSRALLQLAHMCGKEVRTLPLDSTVFEVRTQTPSLPPEPSAERPSSRTAYSPGWRWQ